jgi:pimeloyl-ACP methyl ester carboxylesterase
VKRGGLIVLAGLLVALPVSGFTYERLGGRRERRNLPAFGRQVDIGGRTMSISCSGAGSPTVILESGAASPAFGWLLVQRGVSKFTRVCSYDRAGYGFSDPGPGSHTFAASSSDLHSLLKASGVIPPYVLVGASVGGLYNRVYTAHYPNEVAGLVMVDAAHEDQDRFTPPSMQGGANRVPPFVRRTLCALLPAAATLGVVRAVMPSGPPPSSPLPGFTPGETDYLSRLSRRPTAFVASGREGCAEEASLNEVRAAGTLGDRPLIVLTAGRAFDAPDSASRADAAAYQQRWIHELQPSLARLSTRGRQVVVDESSHGIQFDAPTVVVDAIREVVETLAASPAPKKR